MNKIDLVTEDDRGRLEGILRHLNPRARQVCAAFGRVPLDRILDTGLFDFERAREAPGWLSELRGEHVPETLEYGIGSFVYRARRPFHPTRFWELVHEEWEGVLRSKGFFWLASRSESVGLWSQAGAAFRHGPAGRWWAASPREEWPDEPARVAEIQASMQGPYGDRRQEIVVIGIAIDWTAFSARLDACLLTDEELERGEAAWALFADPFPSWSVSEVEEPDDAPIRSDLVPAA